MQEASPSWLVRSRHSSSSQLLQPADCCPLWTSCEQSAHFSGNTLHNTTLDEGATDERADVIMAAEACKDLFRPAAQQYIKPAPTATYLMGAEELGLCMEPASGGFSGLGPSVWPSGEPAS